MKCLSILFHLYTIASAAVLPVSNIPRNMAKKRCLLWDWTNTVNIPQMMDQINFQGPISSVSNWNAWYPDELKHRAPFRPMVRQWPQLSGDDWKEILSSDESIIAFFNEPERSGISPQQAAEAWFKQMVPLRESKGKKLVSPSCASDPAGQAWIAEFMKRVSSNPPDFLGVHWYGTDGDLAIRYLESMHQKYPRQPIIVSEIASISRNRNDVNHFTAHLANWMDSKPWIFEYGFFGLMRHPADGFVSPEAQLMNEDGSFRDLFVKLMYDQPIRV